MRYRHPLLAVAAGLSLALLVSPPASAQTLLKFHHDLPEDTAQHVAAERFRDLVAERTDGEIEVRIFPNNQLADDVQALQQMQFGAIEGGLIPTAKMSGFEPAMQLPDLPFLFPTPEIAHKFLDSEVGDRLLGTLEDDGVVGVTFWESGFKQFTCNNPIESPDDFEGRKVRVMESPMLVEQFRAMGASAVPIAFSETYTALQQGVVDCQENPLVSIVNMGFYEVQSHVVISNHAYLGYALLFSKRWLDQLDPENREIVVDTAREVTEFQRAETARREEKLLEVIEESDATVEYLPEENRGAFEKATRPVHEMFRDEIGSDLLDAAYEKIDELSRESGS